MAEPSKLPAIIAELRALAAANGGLLLPEAVVAAAQDPDNIMHSRFTWDDTEAAQAYRLWQARQLIKTVVEVVPGVKTPVEVFVSLSADRTDRKGYRIAVEVVKAEHLRELLLRDALAELSVFERKYARLQELAEVFRTARKVRVRHRPPPNPPDARPMA